MRLQIASDLHHEMATHGGDELTLPLPPAPGADALVLAGDIHEGTAAIDLYADYPIPVVYVHGNHEPLSHEYPALVSKLEEKAEGTAVKFLQNNEFTTGGVRFLGACLWTDYALYPLRFDDSLEVVRRPVTEHKLIRRGSDNWRFHPEDARAHQHETLHWLRECLDVPFPGKTVVVTHHLPSPLSIPHENRMHKLSAAYASSIWRVAQVCPALKMR